MTPEIYAEWLRRQGEDVVRTESAYWHTQQARIYQAFPYHALIHPMENELRRLLREKRAVALRYSTSSDAPVGCMSYHVVYNKPTYDLADLGPKTRSQVRRGLRNCLVEPIPFRRLAEEGWPVHCDALARQGRTIHGSRGDWERRWSSAGELPGFEAWGASIDGKLVGTQVTFQMADVSYMIYQQCLRDSLKMKVPNALTFAITQKLVCRPECKLVFVGMQSLDAPPSVDEFKFLMGFAAKPVRQRVVFHPWLVPALNRVTHAMIRWMRALRPGDRTLRKAQGMMSLYLEDGRSVQGKNPPLSSHQADRCY